MRTRRKNLQIGSNAISGTLVALVICASMVWAFFEIADAVVEHETHRFDSRVILALRTPGDLGDPIGPDWVEELARDVTALGGVGVLTFLVLASAGFLWLNRQRRLTVFLLLSVSTGISLSQMLKLGFDRPRPELVSHETAIYTASFPSGHSLMSAIVYLTLAVLVARTLERKVAKGYVILLATFVVIAVGVSRVYLGVHWPTDVLAGWTMGAAWALLCGIVARWFAGRGGMDEEMGSGV